VVQIKVVAVVRSDTTELLLDESVLFSVVLLSLSVVKIVETVEGAMGRERGEVGGAVGGSGVVVDVNLEILVVQRVVIGCDVEVVVVGRRSQMSRS
jgi:hypothetical protein